MQILWCQNRRRFRRSTRYLGLAASTDIFADGTDAGTTLKAAALLIIDFNCPDIAEQVRRPGITQLISVQWTHAESELSEM